MLLLPAWAQSQDINSYSFSYDPSGQSISTFIRQAEANFPVDIFYKQEWIDTIQVRPTPGHRLIDILKFSLLPSGFRVTVKDDYYIFIFPDTDLIPELNLDPNQEAAKRIDWIILGNQENMIPDVPVAISGYVSDATGEAIPGVVINVDNTTTGTVTNPLGHYEILLTPGSYELTFSYLGFESEVKHIKLYTADNLSINLFEQTAVLEEVTVEEGSPQDRIKNTMMGKSDLSIYTINKMPAFLGQADVMKSLTILPGVNVTGESSSYLSVRGGNYDQNLILMNNIPIYNPSHLLGFFSVFNPDMVSKVSLYKGSIPSRYESRASSVLDVKLAPKSSEPFQAYGGIGILTSSLGVKGKVLNDKLSYAIGGRKTYSDWVLKAAKDKDAKGSAANFWDFNAVVDYNMNNKNNFSATIYRASDYFRFSMDTTYSYKQQGFNTAWNHLFSNNMVNNLSVSFSDYQYHSEGRAINNGFYLNNGIKQFNIQNNITYAFRQHAIEAGLQMNNYTTSPGEKGPTDPESQVPYEKLQQQNAMTVSGFAEDEIKLTESLRAKIGMRYDNYTLFGPLNVTNYQSGVPRDPNTISGETSYNSGEKVANYQGWEPKASLSYVSPLATLKFGYNRMYQFQQLVTNAISVTPLDQWKLSDQYMKPVISDQVAIGFFKNFFNNSLEASVETYIKRYQNLVEYKNGANVVMNSHLEQAIIPSRGKAWGAEFLLSKTKGTTQGWFAFTYARTFIRTTGKFPTEQINYGTWYPYYSDRPINISLTLDHKITNRWSFGLNFKYTSGRPVSAPSARFESDNISVAYFNRRNNNRMPAYHRMDVSFTYLNKVKKNQPFRSKWIFSIYNLYARKNAYSIYFKNVNGVPAQAYKLTIAGTLIPSITYKFEFK